MVSTELYPRNNRPIVVLEKLSHTKHAQLSRYSIVLLIKNIYIYEERT